MNAPHHVLFAAAIGLLLSWPALAGPAEHGVGPVALPAAAGGSPARAIEQTGSVARHWNEQLLAAIRRDSPRPTVHARNLFHVSVAMYDAWAAYSERAAPLLHREHRPPRHGNIDDARRRAISYAAYRVLSQRFAGSAAHAAIQADLDAQMQRLGLSPAVTDTRGRSAAALGNRVAATVLAHGASDGANEAADYADISGYRPVNGPLLVAAAGTGPLLDINRWQPLQVPGSAVAQRFLTPHWGAVQPFAPGAADIAVPPPLQLGAAGDAELRAEVMQLIRFSAQLDPYDGMLIDISPALSGNNTLGSNDGAGHPLNPSTGAPYAPNPVARGDWGRVLAEFWADGPLSSTPPGHWNEIANAVSDHAALTRRVGGQGPLLDRLEWDLKLYLALNGALHDAAIATWGAKAFYDCARPITLIRGMGGLGQSSEPTGPAYHPLGLPLEPGLVELIDAESTRPGARHAHLRAHIGHIAIRAWRGHPADPSSEVGGVGWILASRWLPYQQADFVSPPFAGYTSGHSAFSRAAAEVLAAFTGDDYFPGGYGEYVADRAGDGFALRFEAGPLAPVRLQWATYADAADEAGISRIYGGIHPQMDDLVGRRLGYTAGRRAMQHAAELFGR